MKGVERYATHYPHSRFEGHFRLSKMCSESICITKNGYGDMVIMSMKAYEEKLWLLDAYANWRKQKPGFKTEKQWMPAMR